MLNLITFMLELEIHSLYGLISLPNLGIASLSGLIYLLNLGTSGVHKPSSYIGPDAKLYFPSNASRYYSFGRFSILFHVMAFLNAAVLTCLPLRDGKSVKYSTDEYFSPKISTKTRISRHFAICAKTA